MESNTTENYLLLDCDPSFETLTGKILKIAGYVLILIVAAFGNIVVLKFFGQKKRLVNVTNYLICNMAISDLIMAVAGMAPAIWVISTGGLVYPRGWAGLVLCKGTNFLSGISIASSVFNLTAMAGDRFLAIILPLHRFIVQRSAKVMIVLVWLTSALVMSPMLVVLEVRIHPNSSHSSCFENWDSLADDSYAAGKNYTIILFILLYAFPLSFSAVLYSMIGVKLWFRRTPGIQTHAGETSRWRTRKKVVRMLLTVVIMFAVCWLPIYALQFMAYFAMPPCGFSMNFVFVVYFISQANSAINPIVYFIFNKNFRREASVSIKLNTKASSNYVKSARQQPRDDVNGLEEVPVSWQHLSTGSIVLSSWRAIKEQENKENILAGPKSSNLIENIHVNKDLVKSLEVIDTKL